MSFLRNITCASIQSVPKMDRIKSPNMMQIGMAMAKFPDTITGESKHEYHHGPIRLESSQEAFKLAWIGSGVCDLQVKSDGSMCGFRSQSQAARYAVHRNTLRDHLKSLPHGHGITLLDEKQTSEAREEGHIHLMRWVLFRGWRNAKYYIEPGRGPPNGLIDVLATHFEKMAKEDEEFREIYGEEPFHRETVQRMPTYEPVDLRNIDFDTFFKAMYNRQCDAGQGTREGGTKKQRLEVAEVEINIARYDGDFEDKGDGTKKLQAGVDKVDIDIENQGDGITHEDDGSDLGSADADGETDPDYVRDHKDAEENNNGAEQL